ncbi:putative reverse transcriptase domain-containing protein [Tanacetum coccineum]
MGERLTKSSLITHLRDRHCNVDAQAITKQSLTTNLAVFEEAEVTFKRMGVWLCGVCFKTHTLRSKCRHGSSDFVPPPDCGDGIVRFVLYDLTKPSVPSSSDPLDHVESWKNVHGALDKVICTPDDISCWGTPSGSLQLLRETLAEPTPLLSDIDISEGDHYLSKQNIKQCKRKICDGHYTVVVKVISSSGVASYNEATLDDLKTKHPFKGAQWLSQRSYRFYHPSGEALLVGKCPKRLGEYIASAPLTPLVKPGGGIRPIAVGTIWRRLVSKVCATTIGHSLDTYLNDLQFGVGVSGGGEAILHAVNRLIEDRNDDIGLSMLLVDFQNAFNLVDREIMLQEVRIRCPAISHWVEFCYSNPARLYYGEHTLWSHQGVQQGDPLGPLLFALVLHPLICKIKDSFSLSLHAWYLDDGTIIGDTLVVGKVLELIMKDGPRRGLHLNVNKTEVFWPREDPRSRLAGVFPPTIARPLHGVKLLGGPVSVDFGFSSELVLKRVAKSIELMDAAAKLNDPQCELLLLRACAGISKLYFSMRTCSPHVFERAQHSLIRLVGVPDLLGCLLQGLYGDHVVSFAGIVGIKHRHNVVRDTLVDICYRSGISSGKEVTWLGGEHDKSLRPADVLLYSWDVGRDVCVDLTGSSPLTQTGMVDFVPGRAVTEAAQRKGVKYEAKCADIGYGFLSFSFSSFEELEKDAVTLLKRIRKFSMAQDMGARAAVYIFNRISFSIAKGVGVQIVSRLPSNLL